MGLLASKFSNQLANLHEKCGVIIDCLTIQRRHDFLLDDLAGIKIEYGSLDLGAAEVDSYSGFHFIHSHCVNAPRLRNQRLRSVLEFPYSDRFS